MATTSERTDRHARIILDALEEGYRPGHPGARFDVDRASRWSIRIRVVDPSVAPLDLTERDGPIWDLLQGLPDETFRMIGLLFVLAPTELDDSPTNRMFEAEVAARRGRQK